jgi:hypothetical protein
MDVPARRLDGLAALAFGLAVAIMMLPTEADILFVFLSRRQIALAGLGAALCSAVVLVPIVLSWRRHWSRPEAWRGRGYLIAASVIWVVNLLMFGSAFIHAWFR